MGDFTALVAYRRASELADSARAAAMSWQSFDRWTLGTQLVRSADSIGANIAEGFGRVTDADQRRFLVMARGSAHEVEHWARTAHGRGLVADDTLEHRAREVGRLLNGLLRASRPT
jgi:four helix bundle protein